MNLAIAGAEPKKMMCVGFNQDNTSLSVGTVNGYQLFSLTSKDQLETLHTNFTEKEACIVSRLFSSSLVAVVTLSSPRKVKICHFKKESEICNYSFSDTILSVKLNRQRLVVCLEENLYIHNIKDMKVIHTIRGTSPNPLGLCDLSYQERSYLAYPGSSQDGTLQIFDTEALKPVVVIAAHDNPLAAFSFNPNGSMIATASEKGTVIRVYSVPDGARLFDLRRGLKRCVSISSLAFSSDSLHLGASSNTETVHIFKLETQAQPSSAHKEETPNTWTGYLTSAMKSSAAAYLPSPVTDMFSQDRAFATCRLEASGMRTLCAFSSIRDVPYVFVVTEDGQLHIFTLDPLKGGECVEVARHRIDEFVQPPAHVSSPPTDRPLTSPSRKQDSPAQIQNRTMTLKLVVPQQTSNWMTTPNFHQCELLMSSAGKTGTAGYRHGNKPHMLNKKIYQKLGHRFLPACVTQPVRWPEKTMQ
ncbi:WIPI2 [Bugula neritina]|uniref:WIPI2 n=1 Tax=Bugula neritina TaxID=10212 RepID=A0A7J7KCW0_BUGNE|nr:WIPI2 [Bugula neritina]